MLVQMPDNYFESFFSLMEISFPPNEYRTREDQQALLSCPYYTVYMLPGDEPEQMKAFITVYHLDGIAFAEHFAVNPAYRNQGLGAVILRELSELLPQRIVLEVELPETEMAKRRIGFYERNGFSLNHYDYTQPALSPGKQPVPLCLMTTGGPITEEEFSHFKTLIYRDVYHR